MTSKLFASLALAGVVGLSANSFAAGLAEPGSLLVFPCFDSTRGAKSLITVTNTNTDSSSGNIKIEYVYINGANCLETNRTRTLTPGDTLTVVPAADNPNFHMGYLYVFAKNNVTGRATSFNHLVGASLTLAADDTKDYTLAPIVFRAVPAEGADTDLDSDGLRDLNGLEYEKVPDVLVFPRFLGQGGDVTSRLCLINLSGGSQFDAVVDFLVYNDNEEVFSAQYQFRCWARVNLLDISGIFGNDFLLTTNHNTNEIFVGTTNVPQVETGWFSIDGALANSSAATISDPAILGALIECLAGDGGADLPFGLGEQDNGDLVIHSIFGDNT
jgi:hypothetical protein